MMDAARWTLVKRLFEAALGRPAGDRAAFVQTACGADAELRREVESLLAAHADAGRFAEQPPVPAISAPVAMDGVPSGEQSRPLLHPGARIGAYQIRGFVASGGMGDVYRAHDLHLRRDVALKILPVSFAADRDRVARFEREARLLAALNHPHIAAIYGFEQQTDVASGNPPTQALVLEFVEGPTLAERLAKRALPIKEALEIAQQIAEALEAAHEKGIIHRDLKPANIKVTPDGAVKVLDFGLAKAFAGEGGSADLSQMPILTVNRTHEAVIAGTPAYMSPEQARGEAVDVQTDIWAFGVVVYELLTGASPFKGTTTADTLAQVLRGEPDCSRLPSDTPPAVRRLVTRCLEKNRRRRFQHMGDLRIQIEDALTAASTEGVPVSPQPTDARSRKVGPVAMMIGATALAAALIAGAAGWLVGQRSADTVSSGPVRLSMAFVEPPHRQPFGIQRVAISEDGSRIAYAGTSRLWTRRLDDSAPIAVGPSGRHPFFSPDGAWIGLFRETGLVKMPVGGGEPVVIARTSDRPAGASWGSNGTIAFATTEGLFLVSENGGEVKELARPNRQRKERFLAWPHFLPGGRTLLFTVVLEATGAGPTIAWLNADTRETRTVITGASSPRYVSAGGHLLYASGRTLKAVAFDVDESRTLGEPVSLPRIDLGTSSDNGAADFAVSQTGTLIYLPVHWQTPGDLGGPLRTLSWIDRQGREEPLPFEPSSYNYPRVSPDGRRVAVELFTYGNRDIWILNLDRLTRTQLTDGPTEDLLPVWSPDGQRVFFASDRAGNMDVYSQPADGATGARVEFAGPGFHAPQSFTPDGTGLVVYEAYADTGIVRLGQADRLEKLFYRASDDRLVQVSPDGHAVLYESDESGTQFEIFVRPFPNVNAARLQVSTGGGRYARWNRTGDEIFYVALDGAMMAVPVMGSSKLSLGRAATLFQWDKPPATRSGIPYDLSPLDGRFLVTRPVAEGRAEEAQVSVVLNFLSELRATR